MKNIFCLCCVVFVSACSSEAVISNTAAKNCEKDCLTSSDNIINKNNLSAPAVGTNVKQLFDTIKIFKESLSDPNGSARLSSSSCETMPNKRVCSTTINISNVKTEYSHIQILTNEKKRLFCSKMSEFIPQDIQIDWNSIDGNLFTVHGATNCKDNAILGRELDRLFLKSYKQESDNCIVKNIQDWRTCKQMLIEQKISKIFINGKVICNAGDGCELNLDKITTGISIEGLGKAEDVGFIRESGYDKSFLYFSNSDKIILKNFMIDDTPNTALPDDNKNDSIGEKNAHCINYTNQSCAPIIAFKSSKNIEINSMILKNGKRFDLGISSVTGVKIINSRFEDAFLFGIWGSDLNDFVISNNYFKHSRSNAILFNTSTTISQTNNVISNNIFESNHYATAFHSCGNGTSPCAGGQLDIVTNVKNLHVFGNEFKNGKMEGESLDDLKVNLVAGIEVGDEYKENIAIDNNYFHNNSGVAVVINAKVVDPKSFIKNFTINNNRACDTSRTINFSIAQKLSHPEIKFFNNLNESTCESITKIAGIFEPPSKTCDQNSTSTPCDAVDIKWNFSNAFSPYVTLNGELFSSNEVNHKTLIMESAKKYELRLYDAGILLESMILQPLL